MSKPEEKKELRLGPRPTALARKYGPVGDLEDHSAYTPEVAIFPVFQLDPARKLIEDNQKKYLKRFTARELEDLDCLATREIKPGNLQNSIIPLISINSWEVIPCQPDYTRTNLYPLEDGRGDWIASNPVVWQILQPVLVLASKMLLSVHNLPYFDALLKGERQYIEDHRLELDDQVYTDLTSFHQRSRKEIEGEGTAARDEVFQSLLQEYQIQFGFFKDGEQPEGPDTEAMADCAGFTSKNANFMEYDDSVPQEEKRWRIFVFIEIFAAELLLRNDLNSADRAQVSWHLATTIVHEIIHAISEKQKIEDGDPYGQESYFEDETVAENGQSFEHAMFIGSTMPIHHRGLSDTLPLGFWCMRYWPTYADRNRFAKHTVFLKDPATLLYNDYHPVPLTFFEDILQEEFWRYAVRAFGHSIFKFRFVKEGTRVHWTIKNPKKSTHELRSMVRIPSFTPEGDFPTVPFHNTVESKNIAFEADPTSRRALQFGQYFLRSSRAEQVFWDGSDEQNARVQEMMDVIEKSMSDSGQPLVVEDIYALLHRAIATHLNLCIALSEQLVEEGSSILAFQRRRRSLLAWNRGTRKFVQILRTRDVHSRLNLDQPRLDLERARMLIWDPSDPTTHDNNADWIEFKFIRGARVEGLNNGNTIAAIHMLQQVVSRPDCSLFGDVAAALLDFQLSQFDYQDWASKVGNRDLAIRITKFLVDIAPKHWKAELAYLVTQGNFLMAVQPPPQPAAPAPVPLPQTPDQPLFQPQP